MCIVQQVKSDYLYAKFEKKGKSAFNRPGRNQLELLPNTKDACSTLNFLLKKNVMQKHPRSRRQA
jgi:hypothetical protein